MRKNVQKLIKFSELLGWKIRVSNSSRNKRFVSSSELPDRFEAHPASYSMGTGIISREQCHRCWKL